MIVQGGIGQRRFRHYTDDGALQATVCGLTRRGDQAMCVRFWGEITRENPSNVRTDCQRAPFTPKPGHTTRSPRLTASAAKGVWELGAGLQFERNAAERLEAW
ncbi:MAG: hypothetical protein A3K00_01090 [Gallionellales bacterium RIFOXYD2_FULL_52_7]|nr:MAG: hypothetical protein A3K00_01090 [Gallionellales bacterium RIFOXYD2_FULL_52_7]